MRRGEYLPVGSVPVAILPSCQDMKTIALYLEYSWGGGGIRNTSEAVPNKPHGKHTDCGPVGLVSIIA